MSKLEYILKSNTLVGVYGPNKKHVGNLIRMEDGFFCFSMAEGTRVWDGWVLLDIGNKLTEINEDLSKKLEGVYKASSNIDNLDPFNDL